MDTPQLHHHPTLAIFVLLIVGKAYDRNNEEENVR